MGDLQAEVACLRGHKERCEHATLSLLRELLQVRTHVQLQASELRQLRQEVQRAAPTPEKEALEVRHTGGSSAPVSVPSQGSVPSQAPPPLCIPGPGSSPTPSASQFPGPQNQNQMQALDKRYPTLLRAWLSRWGGSGLAGAGPMGLAQDPGPPIGRLVKASSAHTVASAGSSLLKAQDSLRP